ncbi:HBL/NHE enterotoxin family protein [Serratia fonticola]|uniref:HBL/NHE enterotoxin family protein n=1 Tax=Serratia fonticola TaxID=47917 RepID=UPI00217B2260|nr:HBL/NHE enterotoxin family protein [Serratia fonticola]CAI0828631.1 Bacillus haemolytic enterotoxin (HBL) [Serratia fonticola]
MSDISGNAYRVRVFNKSLTRCALLLLTYHNSIKQQKLVDFSGFQNLSKYEKGINSVLSNAKYGHHLDLNNVLEMIIYNMENISKYYELNKALLFFLPPGSTVEEWTRALTEVRDNGKKFASDVYDITFDLKSFYEAYTQDEKEFNAIVSELNSTVGGDAGVLENIKNELGNIQKKIDDTSAGTAMSALGILEGSIMLCVGAIGEFFTAGASTAAVLGGVGLLAAGIGGEATSAIALIDLNNEKASLLNQEANLEAEVKLATALSHGYSSLLMQAENARVALVDMMNVWEFVYTDLDEIINDLTNGIAETDDVRTLFVAAADGEINTLLSDIQILKKQMLGVTIHSASSNQTISELIASLAGQYKWELN